MRNSTLLESDPAANALHVITTAAVSLVLTLAGSFALGALGKVIWTAMVFGWDLVPL